MGSLGVLGAFLGGSEALLGVDVSATNRVVMCTQEIMMFLGGLKGATSIIESHHRTSGWALGCPQAMSKAYSIEMLEF